MSVIASERYLPDYLRQDLAELRVTKFAASTGNIVQNVIIQGNAWMRPLSLWFQVISDATAGVRIPVMQVVDPDSNVFMEIPQTNGQNPSLTASYAWVNGISGVLGGNTTHQASPFPNLVLPSAWIVRFFVTGGVVGDVVGPFRLLWEAIPTGPAVEPVRPEPLVQPLLLT